MGQATPAEVRDNLTLELRRGAVVMAVLAALEEEQYGYSLKTQLSSSAIDIDEGTLYPLLRRLESQGLLQSRWVVTDGRPRRYYRVNAQGSRVLKDLAAEWRQMSKGLERLLRRS
jgi:DNA-binding PadR family transcriptional regulator